MRRRAKDLKAVTKAVAARCAMVADQCIPLKPKNWVTKPTRLAEVAIKTQNRNLS